MSENSGLTFTNDELSVLRKANQSLQDDEFSAFITACKRYGLNPLANQIYAQVRVAKKDGKRKVTYVTQIDGFRLIADRTGLLAGVDDTVFSLEPRLISEGEEVKATTTIYKMVEGEPRSFTASARWSEYYPAGGYTVMWDTMPHVMLGKCSEALVYRKAFPAPLSGLYGQEEMEQAGSTAPPEPPPAAEETEHELQELTHELQSVMIEIDATRDPPVGIESMSAEEFAKLIIEKKNHGDPLTKFRLDELLTEERSKAAKIRKIESTKKKPEPTMRTDQYLSLINYVAGEANMSVEDCEPHVIGWLEHGGWTKLSLKNDKVADEIWFAAKQVNWTTIRAEAISA